MSVHTAGPNTREKDCNLVFLGSLDTFSSNIFLIPLESKNEDDASLTL